MLQPELSGLLDALEQCACHPEISSVLAKSLLRILQLSSEKTVASFKSLGAVPRVLKVASIQAKESRRSGKTSPSLGKVPQPCSGLTSDSPDPAQIRLECMEICMRLFTEFFSIAEDAKTFVLHDSTCIDCLFDLFWEEGMRNVVLGHILDLMKVFCILVLT